MFVFCPSKNPAEFRPDAPAPRPLELFPVRIDNGKVVVDTTNAIRRGSFEPDQVTRV